MDQTRLAQVCRQRLADGCDECAPSLEAAAEVSDLVHASNAARLSQTVREAYRKNVILSFGSFEKVKRYNLSTLSR
jgi:hypothetical protein